jgi:transcriptional regulator with XRE-family HTH domain
MINGSIILNGRLMHHGQLKYQFIMDMFEFIIQQMKEQNITKEELATKMGLNSEGIDELFEYSESTSLDELYELAKNLNFSIHITLTPKKLMCH